ncbi:solute carrier family 25 member 45 isoform X1 [Pelobates cultripes]|uniref:Solute carrier family 25 member 45 isoform X1 n=1 Tax=Pelobates cultripes TaxID=61616 RepID=A0AAD1TKD3_PELCU|nr:solute carrier family 25 member 45 isoform X1 [Pelobates cultripes]
MPVIEFVAGWISGAIGIVVGHPIDTVKVRLQTQSQYRGILDCILKTYGRETIFGFFKGMSFPVGMVAISNSLMFGSYSNALLYLSGKNFEDRANPKHNLHISMAGCFAGGVQVIFTAPVDLIKVRLQNQTESFKSHGKTFHVKSLYKGPFHCAACIFRKEGVAGLYRGSIALALRDVPTTGLYFLAYEVLCKWMTNDGEVPGTWAMLFAGGCAGTVGWAAANPMDVIKSRMQMDGINGSKYRGILDCFVKSVQEEGAKVLLKGLAINSLRAFPVNAVTFLSYELLLQTLR